MAQWLLPAVPYPEQAVWPHLTVREARKYGSAVCPGGGGGDWFADSCLVAAEFTNEKKKNVSVAFPACFMTR